MRSVCVYAQLPPVDPDASLAAAAVAAVPRRVARENIKELLAKKRETLLVQMSLDTKCAEIRKLQVRTTDAIRMNSCGVTGTDCRRVHCSCGEDLWMGVCANRSKDLTHMASLQQQQSTPPRQDAHLQPVA